MDVRRQRQWEQANSERQEEQRTRGIPSYDMMNSMLEASPEAAEAVQDTRTVTRGKTPRFRIGAPQHWELQASMVREEGATPINIRMAGMVGRKSQDTERAEQEEEGAEPSQDFPFMEHGEH